MLCAAVAVFAFQKPGFSEKPGFYPTMLFAQRIKQLPRQLVQA